MNGVIQAGLVDIVEVPYSILDQRAATHLFPLALAHQTSIIVRSPLASEALTGLWDSQTPFPRGDWRKRVFRGALLLKTVERVNRLKEVLPPGMSLTQTALRFCLSHPAVTTVIPGARNAQQVKENMKVQEQGPLPQEIEELIALLWEEDFRFHVRTSVGEP